MRSLPFTGGDEELRQELEKLADPGYKTFHEGLIPGASMSYGVRLPDMRALAQKVLRGNPVSFLKGTHPASYEETMVRGLVVAGLKLPWEEKRPWVEDFLPRVDNWAVCDSFCNSLAPRFPGDGAALWDFLRPLYPDSRGVLRPGGLCGPALPLCGQRAPGGGPLPSPAGEAPRLLRQDGRGLGAVLEWYVKFPRRWGSCWPQQTLEPWVQNKAIQKVRESRRVSKAEKDALLRYKL